MPIERFWPFQLLPNEGPQPLQDEPLPLQIQDKEPVRSYNGRIRASGFQFGQAWRLAPIDPVEGIRTWLPGRVALVRLPYHDLALRDSPFHRSTAVFNFRRALTTYAFAPLELVNPSNLVIASSGISST